MHSVDVDGSWFRVQHPAEILVEFLMVGFSGFNQAVQVCTSSRTALAVAEQPRPFDQ